MQSEGFVHLLRIGGRTKVLAVAVALLWGAGCKSENPVSTPDTSQPTSGAPADWTVRIGSSGGFTGGASGYVVGSDGRVTAWSRATADADVTSDPVGVASESSVEDLYSAMTSADLLATTFSETGNMTIFLEWTDEQGTRRYSWAESSAPPEPVAQAYRAARAAVENARSGTTK
jgi:hypothetical protein